MIECPMPLPEEDRILLAHGGGGRLMKRLIENLFAEAFGPLHLESGHDSAIDRLPEGRFAFTTDSYVVRPLQFPGGDIGKLAVCGTVNDLAMAGAEPYAMSTAFILEEGLSVSALRGIVRSMREAASEVGVKILTGDTKVVERGKGDGIYINTSGIGIVRHELKIHPSSVQPGDAVIVSGDLGRHGIAVMSARDGLAFDTSVESDVGSVWAPVRALLDAGIEVHCLRDLTRGGLASALNEIAQHRRVSIEVHEKAIPVENAVRGACEILGFDPLHVANEGRFLLILPESESEKALSTLRLHPISKGSMVIGHVTKEGIPDVMLVTPYGTRRPVEYLSGEQLPRIC